MNTEAIGIGVLSGECLGAHQPLYFPSGAHTLFGWLHRPPEDVRSDWGVVVCKPFGYEALCAHRSIRAFADTAADVGMPVLRFDYAGTGDSADIDPGSDQVELWVRDIAAAVGELRRLTGVSRICLLGFRLGALLALVASRQCRVDALSLVAPVLNGKRYLREIRTLQLAADAAEAESAGTSGPRPRGGAAAGSLEISGYILSEATLASLARAEGAASLPGSVQDLLILDRSDLPAARSWSATCGEGDTRVDYQVLPGFVEMMLRAPQFAERPEQMLAATRAWLLRLRDRAPGRPPRGPARADLTKPPAGELVLHGESAHEFISERPVFIGPDRAVFGILAVPRRDELRRRAVILLNIGADYHMGASRMYVSLARRWARRGYFVLRLDLAGLGDSPTRSGRRDNEVFPPEALEDIRAAIDFLLTRHGIREVTLAGVCSGAYHALRAAVAGLPIQRALIVNAANYFWDEQMSLEGLQLAEVAHNPSIYRKRIFALWAWKRFLTGKVNIWRIVRVYLSRLLLEAQSRLRDLGRALGIRLRRDLGRELESVIARGVQIVFIFARGEPGINLLRLEAGSSLKRLGHRCRVRIIDSADHTFSRYGARQVLERVASEELFMSPKLVNTFMRSNKAFDSQPPT